MHDATYTRRMTPALPLTAEELLAIERQDRRVELVRGALVVREPAGFRHGEVAMRLGAMIWTHARAHGLGTTCAAETGFTLRRDPDTVRAPDVAFIAASRCPAAPPLGFAEFAPDLVVEVVSPGDRPGERQARVGDWLTAGTRLVWVVDPQRAVAQVYRADGSVTLLGAREALDGEDVLPGFACPLEAVLE
jgi:Uma2 family endonuclease